jgi:hypothetical protein
MFRQDGDLVRRFIVLPHEAELAEGLQQFVHHLLDLRISRQASPGAVNSCSRIAQLMIEGRDALVVPASWATQSDRLSDNGCHDFAHALPFVVGDRRA